MIHQHPAPSLIEVVAGIIFDAQRRQVLLGLRKPDQHQGDLWEFPGGKLAFSESQEKCLRRELHEELGIVVGDSVHRETVEYQYPDKAVRLYFRDVLDFSGQPEGKEGQRIEWVALQELATLKFPAANQPIVDQLIQSAIE